jgi:hypothetical protein
MTIPNGIDMTELEQSTKKIKVPVSVDSLQNQCDSGVLSEIFLEFLDSALRYTESVCRFQQIVEKYAGAFDEDGEREEIENVRGSIHDLFIANVNILARMMFRYGKDGSWRDKIGEDRASLGRFALCISFQFLKQHGKEAV